MGREGEIVNPACFHLDLAMGDQLSRIHQQACPIAMHDATDLRQIVEDAEDIRSAAHGHQLDALLAVLTLLVVGAQERLQLVQIHKAVGVHRQSDQRDSRAVMRHGSSFELCSRIVFTTTGLMPCSDSWLKLSATRLMASVVFAVKITS